MTSPAANVIELPTPPDLAIQVARRVGFVPPHSRQQESWNAAFALDLRAFATGPDATSTARTTLASALVEWVAGARDGLAVQLRIARQSGDLSASLVFDVAADTRDQAMEHAVVRSAEATQLLATSPFARFSGVRDESRLADRLTRGAWTSFVVAQPRGGGSLPLSVEALDAAALDEVLALLLAARSDGMVLVSCRRAPAERAVALLAERLSTGLAATRGRAEGLRFTSATGSHVHLYPNDVVELSGIAALLEREAQWVARLQQFAVEVQVAVVSDGPVGAPLRHAVQRALVPSMAAEWLDLGRHCGAALLAGANAALDATLPTSGPDDTVSSPTPERTVAERWVPVDVAARLFALPVPGPDGLPGIPVDPLCDRGVPNALSRVPNVAPRIGVAVARRREMDVRIGDADLARHLYVVGKTGVGKSTLIRTLLVDLARKGQGIGLIDPHGDLADEIIEAVGPHRPITVFDPSDPECPGLDPIAHDGSVTSMERAMEDITSILFRLYPREMMGPMFDRQARALLAPLMIAGEGLDAMSRLASDDWFRTKLTAKLDAVDPLQGEIRRFWLEEYSEWSSTMRAEMQSYTVSKFDALIRSTVLRRVCDPRRPQLDVAGIVANGGVLVARLPESGLGPVSAWFLGMLLMSRVQAAVFGRSQVRACDRRPFTLAMDEFQKFVGGAGFGYAQHERTFAPMLSEGRKFGLRLVLAHQYCAQLDEQTRQAVFGNVGNLVCFRSGAKDAEILAEELSGVSPAELRGMPLYHALARLLVDGEPTPVFTLRTVV